MFCPKCGGLLVPKKEGSKTVMTCSCGYKEKQKAAAAVKEEKPEQKQEKVEDDDDEGFKLDVVEEDFETHPITQAECPKCQNKEAYYWEVQTRAADEPPTKFLKCTKCKHIWRDYS